MTGIMPPNSLAYIGQIVVPFINRTFPPTTSFNDFTVPTIWIDTLNENAYILVGKPLGVADWVLIGASSGPLHTLTGNTGPAVDPQANNTFIKGDGTYLTVDGNNVTATLTISPAGGLPTTFTCDTGSAAPSAGNINVVGVSGLTTSGTGDTISIDHTGDIANRYDTDSGSATPSAGVLRILGGTGMNTSAATNAVTVSGNIAQAAASSSLTNTGVSSFDSSAFGVDGNGFVTLVNPPPPITTGTFTPLLEFGGASTGITYASQQGVYYTVGNVVFFSLNFHLTSKGSATGQATIAGLPFANGAVGTNMFMNITPSNVPAGAFQVGVEFLASATLLEPYYTQAAGSTLMNNTIFTNSTSVLVEGIYFK